MSAPPLVRAAQALLSTALVAGVLGVPPADAREGAAPQRATNPTGIAAGSRPNGAGNLKLSLVSTDDGKIRVSWKRPAPPGKLRKFVVRVGPNRQLSSRVRTYRVSPRAQSITVDRAYGASGTSGNYSFVKVTVYRKTRTHGSSPTKWIQAPLASPCSAAAADRVSVATFNVRTWSADGRKGTSRFNWNVRGENVITDILRSGAHALALQEASGPAGVGFGARDQNAWILNRLNAIDSDRSARWVDALTDDDYRGKGLIGTRVFYDAHQFTKLASGLYRIKDPQAVDALLPWARLQAVGRGQAPFVLASTHLDAGEKRADFAIRGRQVQQVIDHLRELQQAYGGQVILGGDLNSTANTAPYNNVQRALIGAGLYDSFATTRIAHAAYSTTNGFNFPVRRTPARRDYLMSLGPVRGSCAYVNQAYRQASKVASDHFLQRATLPLAPQ